MTHNVKADTEKGGDIDHNDATNDDDVDEFNDTTNVYELLDATLIYNVDDDTDTFFDALQFAENDTQSRLHVPPLYDDEVIHPSMCQNVLSLIGIYPCLLFSILCWDMIWFIYQDSDYPVRRSVRRNKKSTTTLGFVRKWVMLSYLMMNNIRLIPDAGTF